MSADAETLPSVPGQPQAQASIGRFTGLRMLGAGGVGVVFSAHDPQLDRSVAIKVLRAVRSPADQVRLLREAQAMARLAHPNVVSVFETGTVDDQAFIAMELVDGTTLRGWQSTRRPWRDVVTMYIAAGRGLAAAHDAGLVHRDFKPDNVLVGRDGRPRVGDFGLVAAEHGWSATAVDRAMASGATTTSLTVEGAAMGTPAYMSPEHWVARDVDARSDQFSFCVALWEALAGTRPFAGESTTTIRDAVQRGEIAEGDLRSPARVVAAIRRGLATDRAARWPDMHALLDELARSLAARARAPWLAGGAATLGVGAAVTAMVVLREPAGARARGPAAEPGDAAGSTTLAVDPQSIRRLTFAEGCEELPSIDPDGTILFNGADGANIVRFVLEPGKTEPRALAHQADWELAPITSPDGTRMAFLSGSAALSLQVVDRAESGARRRLGASPTRPSWSLDGRAVWGGDIQRLIRWDATTGKMTRTLPMVSDHLAVRALELPDGRVVALLHPMDDSVGADQVVIYPAAGGAPKVLHRADMLEVLTPTPDGAAVLVAITSITHTIDLWRVPLDGSAPSLAVAGTVPARNGLALRGDQLVWSDCQEQMSLAVWRSDGPGPGRFDLLSDAVWADWDPVAIPGTREVVFLSDRSGQQRVYRAEPMRAGAPTSIATGDLEPVDLNVSPDGKLLAMAEGQRGLYVMPLDGSAPPRLIFPEVGDLKPTFSRDGATLYFERRVGAAYRVAAIPVAGGEPHWVAPVDSHAPSVSPTADVLAYMARSPDDRNETILMLLDLRTGQHRPLERDRTPRHGQTLRWSPDGKRLLVVSNAAGLVELDVATGRELRSISPGAAQTAEATYLGDEIILGHESFVGDLWTARLAAD